MWISRAASKPAKRGRGIHRLTYGTAYVFLGVQVYIPKSDAQVTATLTERIREQMPTVPEYMYVDLPDGTTIRCKTTRDPVYGFPVTPGFSSPEWEVVP